MIVLKKKKPKEIIYEDQKNFDLKSLNNDIRTQYNLLIIMRHLKKIS